MVITLDINGYFSKKFNSFLLPIGRKGLWGLFVKLKIELLNNFILKQ